MKGKRPFVGILFKCCRVYARVYLNADGQTYEGACPRCGKRAVLKVGPGGSRSRFWSAE